jgi:hypothetical protein
LILSRGRDGGAPGVASDRFIAAAARQIVSKLTPTKAPDRF